MQCKRSCSLIGSLHLSLFLSFSLLIHWNLYEHFVAFQWEKILYFQQIRNVCTMFSVVCYWSQVFIIVQNLFSSAQSYLYYSIRCGLGLDSQLKMLSIKLLDIVFGKSFLYILNECVWYENEISAFFFLLRK